MKTLVLLFLVLYCFLLQGQSFSGWWKGVISRDYDKVTKTESISFHLEQQGNRVTGYTLLHVDSIHFIKADLVGEYIPSSHMLRLTETSVIERNFPDRGEEIFLDRYLLNMGEMEANKLTGKSIPCNNKQKYARSKIALRRL